VELHVRGKKAFISGSTQGIGYAVALALAEEGAEVVLNGRTADRVEAAVRRLRDAVPEAVVSGLAADFEEPDQVARLLSALGDVDILVNNVGVFELREFSDISDADWLRYVDINLMSGVRLARGLLPGMLARGSGRIVFIGTESGVSVPADMVHYGVTKAGMIALSNGLAKLTRGTQVTVNTVLGGPTYSDGVAQTVEQLAQDQGIEPQVLKGAIIAGNQTSLLERFIEPSEIASLVLYLASPLSAATNGAAIRADGGVLTTLY